VFQSFGCRWNLPLISKNKARAVLEKITEYVLHSGYEEAESVAAAYCGQKKVNSK